jgi:phosphoribosylaminoimidazole carboxylase (NCAIR synthetase)
MNYVHLSPHFPPNYYLFSVHLSRLGVQVLGLADEPYESLRPELRSALARYYKVDDLHNYDQLVRACGYLTHRYGKLDRVDSHTEYWMETEARLRTDFNIPGPKVADLVAIKRKSRMKQVFQDAGVAVARGEVVHTLEEARRFIDVAGYPLVAKPDVGVGAANTFKVNDARDLDRFFATKTTADYLLEEFIEGPILTFDGLTDKDGNLVFFSSLRYSQNIMEVVNEDRDIYYYTLRDIPADLEEAGRRVLQAFDVRERFFHFEFFRSDRDGRLIALEVNMRPPGGPTVDVWNYANEVDLYWEWANVVVNNRFVERYTRKYHGCYVGRKYNKNYVHSHQEIMDAFGHCVAHHMEMPVVFSLVMGNYAYILRTPDLAEAIAAAEFILERWE